VRRRRGFAHGVKYHYRRLLLCRSIGLVPLLRQPPSDPQRLGDRQPSARRERHGVPRQFLVGLASRFQPLAPTSRINSAARSDAAAPETMGKDQDFPISAEAQLFPLAGAVRRGDPDRAVRPAAVDHARRGRG
jgi:hypothetical protein